MPTPVDLVTDLPADFEVFGQAVDSSLADLKGGTTGQILSKATNTDMDFVWIANDQGDITGITATSPLTGGGTSGAVTVGIQSASTSQSGAVQLSDSTSTTSSVLAATPTAVKSAYDLAASAYAPAFTNNFYAGKNKIINGDFGIWQRGTTFTSPAGSTFTADRYDVIQNGTGTSTISQQAFTLGTAPVAGYESTYFLRHQVTAVGTSTVNGIEQRIESVRSFAGQNITVSFWAKADTARTITLRIDQFFGSGGSPSATVVGTAYTFNATTSWTRFSQTIALPSISGKTLGTNFNDAVYIKIYNANTLNSQMDLWGVQVEAGSVATAFQTATGTIQGELALCQRYYYRNFPAAVRTVAIGAGFGITAVVANFRLPVTMRIQPTALEQSGTSTDYGITDGGGTSYTCNAVPSFVNSTNNEATVNFPFSAVISGGAAVQTRFITTSAYLGWSAEL